MNIEEAKIILNQLFNVVFLCEIQKFIYFDLKESPISFLFQLSVQTIVQLNQFDFLTSFFNTIRVMNGVSLCRIGCIEFYFLQLSISKKPSLDKLFPTVTSIASELIHFLRLTPGIFENQLITNIQKFSKLLIEATICLNNSEQTNRTINFFADLFHAYQLLPFSNEILQQIKQIPRANRQKRYSEMIYRCDPEKLVSPSKVIIQDLSQYTKSISKKRKHDQKAFLSLSCRAIHYQMLAAIKSNIFDLDSDAVIDLWNEVFETLYFSDSIIYQNCPVKYTVSDLAMTYQQRAILIPMNPSIEKDYALNWKVKYNENPPPIRLNLREVLQYTPISFRMTEDVEFANMQCGFLEFRFTTESF